MRLLSKFVLIMMLLASCKAYKISSTDSDKVKGIPFLTKKVVIQHKTTYAEPFVNVTATATNKVISENDTTSKSHDLPKVRFPANSDELQNLVKIVTNNNTLNVTQFNQLFYYLMNPPDFDKPPTRIGNVQIRKIVADTTMYYYNQRNSWFGSSENTFKLNGDNMLTEGSSSQSTDISSLLTTWIPGSSIIEKVFNLTKNAEDTSNEKFGIPPLLPTDSTLQYFIEVNLNLEGGVTLYEFTKEYAGLKPDSSFIPFNKEKNNFTQTVIMSADLKKEKDDSKTADEDKESGKKISINGSITLPNSDQE